MFRPDNGHPKEQEEEEEEEARASRSENPTKGMLCSGIGYTINKSHHWPLSGLNTVSSRRCFFLFTIMILAYSIGSCTLWNHWNYFRYFWPALGMDRGNCAYVRCISGWFWALRVAPRVTDSMKQAT